MKKTLRIVGIGVIYLIAMVAWMIPSGVVSGRSQEQKGDLSGEVRSLWGEAQSQRAPELLFLPDPEEILSPLPKAAEGAKPSAEEKKPGADQPVPTTANPVEAPSKPAPAQPRIAVPIAASQIDVSIDSDPRRKGLVWFALYDVHFQGIYRYKHARSEKGRLLLRFALPTTTAIYDDLNFEVNGKDERARLQPESGVFEVDVPVTPGEAVVFRAGYGSRGMDEWTYRPRAGVERLENFSLKLDTNFRNVDFPALTLSPSIKTITERGVALHWDFRSTVTGQGMGMVLPKKLQPGELAAALSFSAPVSLLFFFIVIFVIATLRGLDIHPINYLLMAAAFFAFHLLFAYSVDHVSVPVAFAAASLVSMFLVATYLRLVVSPQFAFREAALAQLIYLVLFSLAHFWQGFTGLTITVMAVLTLFGLMQATGRMRFDEKPKSPPNRPVVPLPIDAQT